MPHRMQDLSLPGRVVDGDFAGWLNESLTSRGISQRVLAMRSGISHSTISRIIGGRSPSLGTAVAILSVLIRPPLASDHQVTGGEQIAPRAPAAPGGTRAA